MSGEMLDVCLADICRGPKAEAFTRDPEGTLREYDLRPEVRDELLRCDLRALLARGAHPMLVMYLARMHGVAGAAYIAAVRRS